MVRCNATRIETAFINNHVCHFCRIYRVILDRYADMDDMWSSLDFTIHESKRESADSNNTAATATTKTEWYRDLFKIYELNLMQIFLVYSLVDRVYDFMEENVYASRQVTLSTKDSACAGA